MTRSTNVALLVATVVCLIALGMLASARAMPTLFALAIGLVYWALWAASIFAVVYFATRLAIRHERRTSDAR